MSQPLDAPYLFELPALGNPLVGFISVAEGHLLPFPVQRVYWTYATPPEVSRGRHAHHALRQVVVAAAGRIIVHTESLAQDQARFVLERPNQALYLPALNWHWLHFEVGAVLLALASAPYDEADYIRSYSTFRQLQADWLANR
jgi:hypothetical protein